MTNSLLPYSMQDLSNLTLEECLNQALNIDLSLFLTSFPENVSDDILYELAKMYHVQGNEGWNTCLTREEKVNLIKNSIKTHRIKGTKKSIISRLSGTNVEILSWNEYGGIPNHYKIRVYTDEFIENSSVQRITDTILENKRFSAKQDSLEINILLKDELDLTTVVFIGTKTLIK